MGDGQFFPKISFFNKYLSIEPNFSRIHFAGKSLVRTFQKFFLWIDGLCRWELCVISWVKWRFLIVLYLLEIREMVAYVILNHVSNNHPPTDSEDSGEIVKQLRIIITSLKGMQFKNRK